MVNKIQDDVLKQSLVGMILLHCNNPKIRTDKSRKRLILDGWKAYIHRAIDQETDPIEKCKLHGLYCSLGSYEQTELTYVQFVEYAHDLIEDRFV